MGVCGFVCGLLRINGKNGKNGERCGKWLILKGLVSPVFYSVFYSVLMVKTGSCLRGLSYRVRRRDKLVGGCACMLFLFPFLIPFTLLIL